MMINALNSSTVRLDEKKQVSLYDTPLRELFEEARKAAEERFKKTKLELTKDKEKENEVKTTRQNEAWDEWVKLKEFTKEKIKEEIKANLTQNAMVLNANPLNAGSEKANGTSGGARANASFENGTLLSAAASANAANNAQAKANFAGNTQASNAYNQTQNANSRQRDELTKLLAMMI